MFIQIAIFLSFYLMMIIAGIPASLGKEQSSVEGTCFMGSKSFEKCLLRMHSHGAVIHFADTATSAIPLISFQSDHLLFPNPNPVVAIRAEQRPEKVQPSNEHLLIDSIKIDNVRLQLSDDLLDQLSSGTLRVSLNISTADIQISDSEFKKLIASQNGRGL